ncbi:hypothetical protein HUJ05_002162 [Dendroctonus ponderosae]|nr:hypothetical protein HUJ05_002162 [Dendroctonus ponderosae]
MNKPTCAIAHGTRRRRNKKGRYSMFHGPSPTFFLEWKVVFKSLQSFKGNLVKPTTAKAVTVYHSNPVPGT